MSYIYYDYVLYVLIRFFLYNKTIHIHTWMIVTLPHHEEVLVCELCIDMDENRFTVFTVGRILMHYINIYENAFVLRLNMVLHNDLSCVLSIITVLYIYIYIYHYFLFSIII